MARDPYEYFAVAFRDILDRSPRGTQSHVADVLGKSRIHINAILSGNRGASQFLQSQIAEALGRDYIDMLTLGRSLLEGEPPPPAPDSSSIPPDILEAVKDERIQKIVRAAAEVLKDAK